MSFFERMMKVTHNAKPKYSKQQEQIYNEQQTAPNQQYTSQPLHLQQKKILRDFSLKSSLFIKVQQPLQDCGWEEILQQAPINPVYKSVKPVLMSHLLPQKEQLMRDMLAKKKQFELRKKQLNEQKAIHLENMIEQQSYKFKASLSMGSKMSKMKQSHVTDKNKSPAPRKLSQNKPNKPLTLEESIYSASLHTQIMPSPVAADAFNREIMLKLINIIQKQRQSTVLHKSTAAQRSSEPISKQREGPIIINNIMKTPMQNLSRDLIDRQLKIRMLQNTRLQKQFQKDSSAKRQPKQSVGRASIVRQNCSEFQNQYIILTDRSNKRVQTAGFQLSANTNDKHSQQKSNKKSSLSFQNSQQIVMRKLSQSNNGCKNKNSKNIKAQKENQVPQSTKYNSKNESLLDQEVVYKKRERTIQKQRRDNNSFMKSKNSDQLEQKKHTADQKQQIKPQTKETNQPFAIREEYRPPVLMEIPLENQSNMQGLSLAQAFKRKIGRLKSQEKIPKKSINKLITPKARSPKIQQMPSQMTITLTDKLTECNSQFGQDPLNGTIKHSNFSQEQLASKRSVLSKNKSKAASVYKGKTGQMSSSKCIKEPSKQLVDRLIYGEKAKISKQQMYALTKKNYANLPQVQAKRKEEQKRKAQQDRLTKAREYQKAIRAGRSQK